FVDRCFSLSCPTRLLISTLFPYTTLFRSYSTLNEGYGKVLRYGAYSDDVLARLRWLRDVCAPAIGRALKRTGGLDMKSLIAQQIDRKSTRLNSSHVSISYAVFCLKKKKNT